MSISCGSNNDIETGEVATNSTAGRNVVKISAVTIPTYVGRRVLDAYRTKYYGLGDIVIGDYETGDVAIRIPITYLPMTVYIAAPMTVGNAGYLGLPNTTLRVNFCTVS